MNGRDPSATGLPMLRSTVMTWSGPPGPGGGKPGKKSLCCFSKLTVFPVMAAGPDVSTVFEFLRRNGFVEAESALRDEIAGGKEDSLSAAVFDELPMPPPPVRIAVDSGTLENFNCDSNSTSSDDFVSLGSSTDSELINPYGIWISSQAVSEDSSSDRLSEFGTAREYNDSFWYNEKDGFFPFSSSVDKHVMAVDAEERLGGIASTSASVGFLSVTSINDLENPCHPFARQSTPPISNVNEITYPSQLDAGDPPLCDCCSGMKGYYGLGPDKLAFEELAVGGVKGSNLSPYVCNELMPYDPKSLEIPEMTKFQLNLEADAPELISWEQNVMHYSHRSATASISEQILVSPFLEKELQVYDSFAVSRMSSSDFGDSNDRCLKTDTAAVECGKNIDADLHISENLPQLEGNDASVIHTHEFEDMENIEYIEEENATPTELQIYENQEDEYEVFDLRIIHRKNRTGFEENKDFPVVLNTIIAGRYYVTEYLGSAAFSKVIQAHDLQTGMDVCLKIIKNDKDFFDQSLDEIKLLKFVNKHDPADEHHILRLYDYFYHQEHLFIVCELLRANLYEFQKYNHDSGGEVYFTLPRLQSITRQCLEALEFLHQLGIIHCDLKPENILIKSYSRCEIKVIDLGSSCFQSDNLCLYVQSRSYRAPEVILGLPYNSKIDIWSLGCILAELCSGEVLFPNDTLVMLLSRMIGMLGPIDMDMLVRGQETHKYFTGNFDLYHRNEENGELEYIIPEKFSLAHHLRLSDARFIRFISDLLQTNPVRRPSATEALQHPWLSYSYQ
ncbi:hypothetical protein H6P81_006314 [Aristolochia fimbriata]|uniref:Protein kinase domain-containing protein n=1 Tax=Aristolochia fimbriata TaxID=158543 RepID=A0AAV7EWY9_ARIFI|nr:hypothetical protein H6P81_006314 [Aristolochia fimbriata]